MVDPKPRETGGTRAKELEVSEQPEAEAKKEIEVPTPVIEGEEDKQLDEKQDVEKEEVVKEHEGSRHEVLGIDSMETGDLMSQVNSLEIFLEDGEVNIEKVKQHAAYIPLDVLYQLEDKRPGALLETFSTKTGDTYDFNFQNNVEAEATIGLSVFFKNLPEIRAVNVTASEEEGGKVEKGIREGYRGNFYENEEYVEVMDGYEVEVVTRASEDKLPKLKKEWEKSMGGYEKVVKNKDKKKFEGFFGVIGNEKYADIPVAHIEEGETLEEKLTHRIFEVSADGGVDPYLTMSLLMAENGDNGKFFGVLITESNGFESQLDWAVQYIKKYEIQYEMTSGKKSINAGHYSVNFLSYFSEIYSPSSLNPNHFTNLYENYFKLRGIPLLAPADLRKRREKGKGNVARTGPNKYARENMFGWPSFNSTKLTPEQLQKIETGLGDLKGGARVAELAKMMADPNHPHYVGRNVAGHCGKWCGWVYYLAGAERDTLYRDLSYRKGRKGAVRCHPGIDKHAIQSQLDNLQPGDWLWINGPSGVNHSVIFLGWEGSSKNKQAKTANLRAGRTKPSNLVTFDLEKRPVVNIYRPV